MDNITAHNFLNLNSNTTATSVTDPFVPYITKQLTNIAPVNLMLCLLALPLNSFIIHHYYSTCTRVLPCLFMMIAAADIATALGHASYLISLLTIEHHDNSSNFAKVVAHVGSIIYLILGMFGKNCSIFYNLILNTLRTHVIVVRIPTIRTKLIITAVFVHFIFWFTFLCIDLRNYAVIYLSYVCVSIICWTTYLNYFFQ